MNGHGGARNNSGRPSGGISQTRRVLIDAIERGLAIAGRKRGMTGNDEEVAAETTAHIVSDMVLAGEGRDVIKIFALATSKSEGTQSGQAAQSSLIKALKRLPRGKNVRDSSVIDNKDCKTIDNSISNTGGAPDCQLVAPVVQGDSQPFFSPQKTLEFNNFADSTGSDESGTHPHTDTPYTPREETPGSIGVNTENFEKNNFSDDDLWGDACPA